MNSMEASSNVGRLDMHTVKCGVPLSEEDKYWVPKNVPEIKNLNSINPYQGGKERYHLISQIEEWVKYNPDTEHIYTFHLGKMEDRPNCPNASSWLKNCIKSLSDNEQMGCVVAGSYALWTLEVFIKGYQSKWKPSDVDLFVLNREKHARHSPAGGMLDIVHTTDKTPVDVITNFDLPCCRVAFDMNYTFYVSIHALYSVLKGKVMVPRYLKTGVSFKAVLRKYHVDIPDDENKRNFVVGYYDRMADRMTERIMKYQSRGYSFQWYDTDYVLPWIRQRFAYVDFDLVKEINNDRDWDQVKYEEEAQKLNNIISTVTNFIDIDPIYRTALDKHKSNLIRLKEYFNNKISFDVYKRDTERLNRLQNNDKGKEEMDY